MKTFIHDMKVLKYHKDEECKSIILFCCGMVFVGFAGKLIQKHTYLNPLIDPFLFLWFSVPGVAFWIILYSVRYVTLDRKMLRKLDEELDAELKWKSVRHDFNKKCRQ